MPQEPNQPPANTTQELPNSVSPTQVYRPAGIPEGPVPQNNAGTVGMILSLVGVICWLTFPLGLIVSLIALRRKPRLLAAVGSVVGALGTLFLCVFLAAWGNVILSWFSSSGTITPQQDTLLTLQFAASQVQSEFLGAGQPPDPAKVASELAGHLDSWGNTPRYEPGENNDFVLRSAGKDLTFDTADDITYGETFGAQLAGGGVAGAGGPAQGAPTDTTEAVQEDSEAGTEEAGEAEAATTE